MSHQFSYKLSPTQLLRLEQHLKAEQSGVDIEQIVCSLKENLHVSTFQQAWQQVIQRHPALRTSFGWSESGEPLQTVHPQVEVSLMQQDWCNLSHSDRDLALKTYVQSDRQRGFNLTETPLIRLTLIRLSVTDYKLIWTFHPIILDSHSAIAVLKEVFAFYEADTQGENLQLAAPRPYQDYIEWLQQQDVSSVETDSPQTFPELTAPTPLSVHQPADLRSDSRSDRQQDRWSEEIRLSPTVTSSLNALCLPSELTLNTLILAAWALLLGRYSSEPEVTFSHRRTGRQGTLEKAESIVGPLSNEVPLRVNIPPDKPVLLWLKELQTHLNTLPNYEQTPLIQAIATPDTLYESLVTFENNHINSVLQTQGTNWRALEFELLEPTNFPLNLYGYGEPELLLKIEADPNRFDRNTITRMLGHLQTLLEGIAANPQQHLSQLPLLTAAEQQQLLVEWNQTQTNYPQVCIHELFETQAEQTPDAIAAVFGNQQLTYGELNTKANQLARFLQKLGQPPEGLVGMYVERSLEMLIGLLAILKAGSAYVPFDPAYPPERLAFMLADTQVPVLLSQKHLMGQLPETQAITLDLETTLEAARAENSANLTMRGHPVQLAYIMYTSGSTGIPKGVAVTHRGVVRLVKETNYARLSAAEVFLQLAPISFDASTFEIWGSLLNGAKLAVMPPGTPSFQELGAAIARYQVTILWLTAALFHLMVDERIEDLKPLKQLLAGGDVLSVPHVQKVLRELPGCTLINGYGPTENTTFTCCYPIATLDQFSNSIPIGRPIANTFVYLLDPHLQPVPIGVPGELYTGGSGLAKGYLNRPELTAERFIPNPFSEGKITEAANHLYKTGDLARYLPDGNIEYLGRLDNQVKIRGFRIELGEVEAALRAQPAVKQAVVTAREDTPGDKRLVAYAVPHPDQTLAAADLRRYLAEKLPDYMIPSTFVILEAIPVTANGKLDRRALPIPVAERSQSGQAYIAPTGELEIVLANLWCKLLKFDRVGIHDNFFDLGGNSLLSLQVVSRVKQELNIDLPVVKLFQHPTISALAKYISQGLSEKPSYQQAADRAEKQKAALARRRVTRN